MKRLLCIVGSMDAGGAETFLMKIYRGIDKSKYQFDFCVAKEEKGFYDEEIINMGGKIFHITPKSKGFIKNFIDIMKIVNREKYKYVMRISQHSLSSLELLAARMGGAKKIIFRSSNSNTGGNKLNQILHRLFKFLAIIIPNIKIAPSTEAAMFMFGKKAVRNDKVLILHNGIPFEDYEFSEEKRQSKRKELLLEGKYVIGHVGRFSFQKNHVFLLKVFKKIKQIKKDAVLICIGKGELENNIKQLTKELKLENSIKFLGVRSDVPEIMMAMDIFAFPSHYEGLPNTVIEAQATGLKCVISNKISKEAKITPNVSFLNIEEENIDSWVEEILDNNKHRDDKYKYFKEKMYLLEDVIKVFENEILSE